MFSTPRCGTMEVPVRVRAMQLAFKTKMGGMEWEFERLDVITFLFFFCLIHGVLWISCCGILLGSLGKSSHVSLLT